VFAAAIRQHAGRIEMAQERSHVAAPGSGRSTHRHVGFVGGFVCRWAAGARVPLTFTVFRAGEQYAFDVLVMPIRLVVTQVQVLRTRRARESRRGRYGRKSTTKPTKERVVAAIDDLLDLFVRALTAAFDLRLDRTGHVTPRTTRELALYATQRKSAPSEFLDRALF
jgi:hypothetical protein